MFKFGIGNTPFNQSLYSINQMSESITPPPGNEDFLLLDGTDFLLLDNTNFLLLG